MRPALVRFAILAYPSRWRRRYGAELEELTMSVLVDQRTVARQALTLSDLIGHGLGERVLSRGSTVSKTVLVSAAVLAAAMFAMVGGLASDGGRLPVSVLSPVAHIGTGVSVVSVPPHGARKPLRGVVVELPRGQGGQISVAGAPSSVVIDPKRRQVLSVSAARHASNRN
jgi:hypothetical protein